MAKRLPLSNDKQIQALKPEGVVYEHAIKAGKGLRIKVSAAGKRSWYYRYRNRHTGALERMKLGEHPGMTLAEAREEVDRLRGVVAEHSSAKLHRDVERKRKAEALAAELAEKQVADFTVAKMIREYMEVASRELKSWREVSRCFDRYVIPKLGAMAAADVTRKDVIEMLSPLRTEGKDVQANRVLAYLRKAYADMLEAEKVPANPCADIKKRAETPRERVLLDPELRRLLAALPADMEPAVADVLRFVVLTGLRLGEAVAIRHADIEDGVLTIADTKNSTTHHVYLSEQAAALVESRKGKSLYVFPMLTDDKRHVRVDRVEGQLRDALPKLGVLPFTPHDLRRSFATGLAKLKCPRVLISLALNHTIPGITSRYDKHEYADELREWWGKWGAHVQELMPKPEKPAKSTRAA